MLCGASLSYSTQLAAQPAARAWMFSPAVWGPLLVWLNPAVTQDWGCNAGIRVLVRTQCSLPRYMGW